jgi:hypothetical protein
MEVITYSEEYGLEHYHYDTAKEAEAGYERLKKASNREYKKDNIVREVILVTDRYITDGLN